MMKRGREKNMTDQKTGKIRLHVEESGRGEPLILLMGLGAYARKWEPHREVYEKEFWCISMDNRGSGRSEAPRMEEYTTEMMAEDTIETMDALGIASAHIHGISMGGAIAQVLAVKWPQRVKSLILTSTFSEADIYFKQGLKILSDNVGKMEGTAFAELCNYMIYSRKYHNEHKKEIEAAQKQDEEDPIKMSPYAYRAQCRACRNHNLTGELHKINVPTLITAGDADLFVSPSLTEKLHKGIKNSKLYLCREGGHVHHWEELEQFNKVTMEFLREQKKS